jgi:integrase
MIGPMGTLRYPGLRQDRSRHGTMRYYVRRGDGPRYRVRGEPGTPEFNASYQAALAACKEGRPPGSRADTLAPSSEAAIRFAPGTVGWAVKMYRASIEWAELATTTQRWRGRMLEELVRKIGDLPLKDVRDTDIRAGRDRRAGQRQATPAQHGRRGEDASSKAMAASTVNNWLKCMKGFFGWAQGAGLIGVNPAARVKSLENASAGFPPWSDADKRRFRDHWPVGTLQRVAFELANASGARRSDLVQIGHQHVRDGVATFRPTKTSRQAAAVDASFMITPALQEALDALPRRGLTFLARPDGQARSAKALGNWFREACDAAGLDRRLSLHGIRKRQAELAAELGVDAFALQGMFGWRGLAQPEHYTRKAARKASALRAASLLAAADDELTGNKNASPSSPVRRKSD